MTPTEAGKVPNLSKRLRLCPCGKPPPPSINCGADFAEEYWCEFAWPAQRLDLKLSIQHQAKSSAFVSCRFYPTGHWGGYQLLP